MSIIRKRRFFSAAVHAKAAAAVVTPTWNPADKSSQLTLSNGNLTLTNNTGGSFAGVRSTTSHSSGKFYLEILANTQTFPGFSHFGFANASADLSTYLTATADSVAMTGSGGTYINGSNIGNASGVGETGQTLGIAVDFTARKIWFWVDAVPSFWNGDTLANQNPATGVGGFDLSTLAAGPYFIAMDIWQLNDQFTLNVGGSSYAIGTPPAGFGSW